MVIRFRDGFACWATILSGATYPDVQSRDGSRREGRICILDHEIGTALVLVQWSHCHGTSDIACRESAGLQRLSLAR
jgi:hypothetical protein